MSDLLSFANDVQTRRRLFVPQSFEHPARANLNLVSWLVRRYTQPCDIILDPMAGSGSLLVAASVDRQVCLNEIEPYWIDLCLANAERIACAGLFSSSPIWILEGDARRLPLKASTVNHVLTSPPYWDTFSDWQVTSRRLHRKPSPLGSAYSDERGTPSAEKQNIGNIHIYELYLRAMRQVYAECFRVLRPDGKIILIIKDRIHNGRRVPITADTATLLKSIGFFYCGRHSITAPLTHYRNIHRLRGQETIDNESVLIYEKPSIEQDPFSLPLAIVQQPLKEYKPGHAPHLWFERAQAHARRHDCELHLFRPLSPATGFRSRKVAAFRFIADLIDAGRLTPGRQVWIYASNAFRGYLEERLSTMGYPTIAPIPPGLTLGEQVTWLTSRQN